jgi:uncharacterized repeat protein (TIGR03803 family)
MGKASLSRQLGAILVLCAATKVASAQTVTTLFDFSASNGAESSGALVQGLNGGLYGTTGYGGKYDTTCDDSGVGIVCGGTVFAITRAGTLTSLHSLDCPSGCAPAGSLVLATNGNFYGTTSAGGAHGDGTFFEITPAGALTTLYNFCSQSDCADGAFPLGALIQGTNGNFYGTTYEQGVHGGGTVFEITPGGTLTTLHNFCKQTNCADGSSPQSGLIQAANGDFYGTTSGGGANGGGTIFEITSAGVLTTLYSFCSQSDCADGTLPEAGLALGPSSTLYGTTRGGGSGSGGTIFSITEGGSFTSLYSFCSDGCSTGKNPNGTLVRGTDGNFYGATYEGGAGYYASGTFGGTLFQITPGGALTALYSFCSEYNCEDGSNPNGVIQDTDGSFYGTTFQLGTNCTDCGTVFRLVMDLAPFVRTLPTGAAAGTTIDILGTNLTGATSVTFNGAAATFSVVSSTLITASVPAGATTGIVEVATPSRTLKSNTEFVVR